MLEFLQNFLEAILIALLMLVILSLDFLFNHLRVQNWRQLKIDWKQQRDTQKSLEELGYPHSENYAYIASTTPLWVRLRLSKHRGDRKALAWRIKLLKILNLVGPRTADLLLKEYMLTSESSAYPTPADSWACPKCGTNNPDTALFCKDCGEYK